jgi:DNA-binding MarR family transcriptional regulator
MAADQPDRRAQGVAQILMQVARRVHEKRGAADLHAVQWSALRYFARSGRQTATVNGFARYLGNTTGSASRTVKSLTERGLLEGSPSRHDARVNTLTVTARGRTLLANDPINDVAEALEILSGEELTALAAVLDKVSLTLGERR